VPRSLVVVQSVSNPGAMMASSVVLRAKEVHHWRQTPATAGFGLAFLGTLAVALIQGPKEFFYDSHGYWTLGKTFIENGHFSLSNFNSITRGYVLPLIYRELQAIANHFGWTSSSMVKLFNALLFALIGSVLAPKLAEMAWPERRWGIGRRLALTGLLVAFWSGYMNFPLSDVPALAATLAAIVAAGSPESPGWMFGAGVACALAINIRPGYAPLAPVVVALVAAGWFDRRGRLRASTARRALCAGMLALGFVAISLPQSLSSYRHYHTASPLPGTAAGMFKEQVWEGLIYQRFESYVGANPHVGIYYDDPVGVALLAKLKNHQIETWGQYLELVANHPATMGALLVRRFVNGMDARYTTPYVEHLDHDGILWLRIVGFLLVLLALVRVLWPAARRRLGPARWRYPLALLLCNITSLASHAETRYMLTFYVLTYILVLAAGWPNPIAGTVVGLRRFRTLAILLAGSVAFTALVWHITAVTSSLRHLR
jgi:hypothetical protein